jgi:hypothetical protein
MGGGADEKSEKGARCQNIFLVRDGSPQLSGPPRGRLPPGIRRSACCRDFGGVGFGGWNRYDGKQN